MKITLTKMWSLFTQDSYRKCGRFGLVLYMLKGAFFTPPKNATQQFSSVISGINQQLGQCQRTKKLGKKSVLIYWEVTLPKSLA